MDAAAEIGASEESEEGALIALVRGGDREAFARLLRRYNQRVYRIARAVLADDAEAEDAAQEAWVLAWRKLDQFEGRASFAAWLGRIVVREAIGRSRRRKLVLLDGTEEDAMDESTPDPERGAHLGEARRLLERAIDRLPEHFRTVFVLRAVEELSVAETAASLDLTEETVKTRLHRARRLLREDLTEEIASAGPEVFAFAGDRCDRITAAVLRRVGP